MVKMILEKILIIIGAVACVVSLGGQIYIAYLTFKEHNEYIRSGGKSGTNHNGLTG